MVDHDMTSGGGGTAAAARRDDGGGRSTDVAPAVLAGAVEEVVEQAADRLVTYVEHCLDGLEAMAASPVPDRLAWVAQCAAGAWSAQGWWIGAVEDDHLVTWRFCWTGDLLPAGAEDDCQVAAGAGGVVPDRYAPVEARGELLRALDGGSYVARPGDPSGLGDWLPELGLGAAVAAGGYDCDARQWLLAVLLEDGGADAALARLALTSVVQAALVLPVAVRRR